MVALFFGAAKAFAACSSAEPRRRPILVGARDSGCTVTDFKLDLRRRRDSSSCEHSHLRVRLNGGGRRRLTFMNTRGSRHSVGHYRLAGVVSFDSDRSFYGDVMTQPLGLVGKIVKVTCDVPF